MRHHPQHGPGAGGHGYGPPGPGGAARRPGGGVPDGLIAGLIGAAAAALFLVWSSTGLAGLLAHGSWPSGVSFSRAPRALRSLIGAPDELPPAWPETPPGELSGYGLFWGLVIGQVMILFVLAVFAVGTLARWKAVRRARLDERTRQQEEERRSPYGYGDTIPPAVPHQQHPQPATPSTPLDLGKPAPEPEPHREAEPPAPAGETATADPAVPAPRPAVFFGGPDARRPSALGAVRDAEGPLLVVTSDPAVWAVTKDARAKLGPVHVYDPGHLCDTPARLHWSPTAHCEDAPTARDRAVALLAPVRPHARIDAAMADTAETLLHCWLHAAAVDGRPFKQVHRWAQGINTQESVRILRTHTKATAGLAGLLEAALTAHPERREIAQQLVARALSSLSSIHIREACTPNRTDALALESFINEGGTLYLVGEPQEDPRAHPGAMPLLTALASDVVEHGRRMAARSSAGRLDPPLTLVLDDAAAVAPLPQLPALLASGPAVGLPAYVLLRSPEQARSRWQDTLPR
ncbi:type VI secretion protein [Streptomyces tsukubensis]